ncbi:MAG: alpha/beta hydrolase [Acetobacteraceae bacterium]|nr:alpha/beta hydrolase [Acetobacteraceae bacterium]
MADPEIAALRELLAQRPRPPAIADRRTSFDAFAKAFPTADDIVVEPVSANGVLAEWNSAPGADTSRAVLYLHGGGYVIGSLDSHRHVTSEIARDLGARTLALHYRLSPEQPFPAPVEDAVAGYRYLLSQGIAPGNIAIAGDSAGGGLVVAALVAIREAGLAQPSCGWCISPWVDLEGLGGSMTSKAAEDPMVQKEPLLEMSVLYLNGADPRSPLAAPMYADLRGIAPLFIQVGAAETLLDDSIRLSGIAGAAHVPVTMEVWPEMVHVWHLFHPRLAAGRRAITAGARYVRAAMDSKQA